MKQKRLDTVSRKMVEVDSIATLVAPEAGDRRRATRAVEHSPDKEYRPSHQKLSKKHRRCDVEQVKVIDHEHETIATAEAFEDKPRPGEHLDRVKPLRGAVLRRIEIEGQQMRYCGKRNGTRFVIRVRPTASAAQPLGDSKALLS